MANIAEIYTQQGQVNRALDSLEKAVEIAREVGDRPDYSDRLNALGIAQRHLKQLDASIKTFSEALAIAKEIGNERLQGTILGNRGLAFADAKQPYDAVRDVKRAVDLAQQTKDRHGEGNYLSNLGSQCMALMIHDYAFKYLEAALAIAHEIGDVKGEAMRLGNLGATAHSARRFDDAIRYSEQAREKFLTLGLNQLAKQSEDNIVKAHRDRQSVEAGGGLFDGAFDQMVANQTRTKTYSMALAALQIAEDSLQQNRIQEAAAYAIQSHKLASAVNAHDVRAKCMSFLGELQVQQRLYNEAILHFHQSAAIAHIVGEPGITVEALLKLGKVHLSRGDRFLCLHYYNEALDLAKQQNLESLIPKIEVAIKQV